MKTQFFLLSMLFSVLIFSSCQKEFSLETTANRSAGSLQSNVTGECLPKTVQGIYEAGTVLSATAHYIEVQVNVAKAGTYFVNTDTINGMFFQATGSFAATGLNTVRLTGNGTPLSAGINNFTITYDSTVCKVPVSILPPGAAGPATFTLSTGPNTCLDYVLSGAYINDVQLTVANTVVIKVNVTAIGTYSITTPVSNGITFSGTGSLTASGNQTITLTAAGKPAVTGSTNIAVTSGTSSCSFPVEVTGPAVFIIDCASALLDGTYEKGLALDATNTVDIDVNVTTPGGYAITTTAVNGITFSGAGNLATAGPQTITLSGSGNPIAEGTTTINISGGGSSCSFDVIVDPGTAVGTIDWKFTANGTTVYQGSADEAILNTTFGISTLSITDADGALSLTLTNSAGGISTGIYSGTATTGKVAIFTFLVGSTDLWQGAPTTGSNLSANLTVYNTTTKIAEGTFSGTVKDAAGTIINITAGTFKVKLP